MHKPLDGATGAISLPIPVIYEAGHYYQAKGPTAWSELGWKILSALADPADARVIFVDDVHTLGDVNTAEVDLPVIEFNPEPAPTHTLLESAMRLEALEMLEALKALPKKKRARKSNGSERWHCGEHQLTKHDGTPLCLLLDLGLSYHKHRLGFRRAVNIVPEFYEEEQRALLRLVEKALPELRQEVILYDFSGRWRRLE